MAHRPVHLGGPTFPPGGHRSGDGGGPVLQAPGLLHPAPGLVRVAGAVAVGQQRGELPLGPGQAAALLEASGLAVVELDQVGDVGGGVLELTVGERSAQPVTQAVGLGEADPQLAGQQGGQRGGGRAEEAGGDLGVEEAPGHGGAGGVEHLEVLAGGVHHGQAGALEQWPQPGDVDLEGVDEGDLVVPGQLDQGQLGEVRALAVELGVEGPDLDGEELLDESGQVPVVGDDRRRRRGQEGAGPESTGRPASIQARVPPATLTASTPVAQPGRGVVAAVARPAHDRHGHVGGDLVDPLAQLLHGEEGDAGDARFDVLVGVADVEHVAAGGEPGGQLLDVDLGHVHGREGTGPEIA